MPPSAVRCSISPRRCRSPSSRQPWTKPECGASCTCPSIEATIARAPGHHGIGALRRAAAQHDRGRGIPVGDFERRAIGFLREHDFPPYQRNYAIKVDGEPFTLDVVWFTQRVAIEFDSRTFHDNDPDFVTDRRRSRRLAAIGWQVVRATWVDLDERPGELAADVWALLRARGL